MYSIFLVNVLIPRIIILGMYNICCGKSIRNEMNMIRMKLYNTYFRLGTQIIKVFGNIVYVKGL